MFCVDSVEIKWIITLPLKNDEITSRDDKQSQNDKFRFLWIATQG
ncbi:hypothetical protein [Helicobacter fennelliae]|uniref:Uncharacterized protein n=1 Tax=Helicobacter fennelliae MRY12-0050 TaxID=1325130 RepID=T1CWI0_9HELI|nr:hypothetical protein [Helicobacter fennelliae]GAD18220.1 hypothetical protein HFN_1818 [Helicobacter fennelliae MRY12-0050]